jgi:hypothetical protein
MAPADLSFIDDALPPEGRTLGEIIERLISREAWDFLTEMVGDRHVSSAPRQLQWFHIPPAVPLKPGGLHESAVRACLPLLEQWNSGAWIARGRRGSPMEPPVEIPPPATGYKLAVGSLRRSVIFEPGSNYYKRIYDVRFYSPATLTPAPPLLVKRDEPAHYRHIRAMADLAFPDGWHHLRQAVVLKGTADQFQKRGEPVPNRDTMQRALGYRK